MNPQLHAEKSNEPILRQIGNEQTLKNIGFFHKQKSKKYIFIQTV